MKLSAAIFVVLLLAGCGGSSSSSSTSVTQPAGSTSTLTSSSAASSTASSSTTTATSTSAGIPPCRASMLSLAYLGQNGATGKGVIGFALHNTSGTTCHTVGYPGVLFLDSAGNGLTTTPTHTTQDFAGTLPLHSLNVGPGQTVSFRLGVRHFGANGSAAGCGTAAGLQVIPPNDTATLKVTIGNGGAYECQTVTVSPLQPGTTAYPF